MSHKGIIGIIIVVTVVAIGGYSTMALIEQQEPIQILINSFQQDITENISLSDEAIIKNLVGDLTNERGRINTVNGSNHHVIINDGVGVEGTVPQE